MDKRDQSEVEQSQRSGEGGGLYRSVAGARKG